MKKEKTLDPKRKRVFCDTSCGSFENCTYRKGQKCGLPHKIGWDCPHQYTKFFKDSNAKD